MSRVSLKLLNPHNKNRELIKIITKHFNETLRLAQHGIKAEIKTAISRALRQCTELVDLDRGELRGMMGLTSGKASAAIDNIIASVSNSIIIETRNVRLRSGKNYNVLKVTAQPSHFQNVLQIPQSSISYYSPRYKKVVNLKWLEWLLFYGDRIVVSEFRFDANGKGRSRVGNMEKIKTGVFRVPPYYSGTANDNFITRALRSFEVKQAIEKAIENNMAKYW